MADSPGNSEAGIGSSGGGVLETWLLVFAWFFAIVSCAQVFPSPVFLLGSFFESNSELDGVFPFNEEDTLTFSWYFESGGVCVKDDMMISKCTTPL